MVKKIVLGSLLGVGCFLHGMEDKQELSEWSQQMLGRLQQLDRLPPEERKGVAETFYPFMYRLMKTLPREGGDSEFVLFMRCLNPKQRLLLLELYNNPSLLFDLVATDGCRPDHVDLVVGADISLVLTGESAPLGMVIAKGDRQLLWHFYGRGLDPNAHFAWSRKEAPSWDGDCTALFLASLMRDEGMVGGLYERGACATEAVQRVNDPIIPLHITCKVGGEGIARLHMLHGAPVDTQNGWGETLLHVAAEGDHYGVAEVLLAAGAQPNSGDRMQRTPLHTSAGNGSESLVKLLLANGANPTLKDQQGMTPRDLALEGGYERICNLLARATGGANVAC